MQQQQQQPASYDLLAVFPEETKAEATASRLRKEGFSNDEVFQLPANSVGKGEFREHGPTANRDHFLQVQRSGPNPILVVLFVVIFGIVLGGLATGAGAIFKLPEPTTVLVGVVLGIVVGLLVGLLRRGRVRGAIGQDLARVNTPSSTRPQSGTLTIVAVRLADADNISRMSRARAMLLNGGGKIDRSVNRRT